MRTITIGDGSTGGRVEFAGEVRARTESRLSFRVAGKMVSRAVDVGAQVRAGQVLARLDAQDLRLGEEAARAAMHVAQANAAQAAADLQRYRDLRAQGFISAAELERREHAHQAAQAQWEQARAQAGVQGNQTGYSLLTADAAGVVTAVEAEPGAVLAAGAPVIRVAHDGPRDVVFSVPEQQVDALRALRGRPGVLHVRMWGEPEAQDSPARIREVAAASDPVTRTYLVKADLSRQDVSLGRTVTVGLTVLPQPGLLRLPLQAVFEQQGHSSVWVLDRTSMTVRAQRIQVSSAEGNAVLVAGGVSAGQTVVSAGVHALTEGQKVSIYAAPAVPASAAAVR
ncbi:MAG TPA: efflux RND transporter periplasmic adaptor subunit [Burkholderiaceae bacterium]|nr:efflux RND transporter periplasmic adaptor subunit [Burkholderiaceae bacterium]